MNIVVHHVDIHLAPVDLSPLIEEMKNMTDQLQRLQDDIKNEDTVIDGAITMINGFASQLRVAVSTAVEAALAANQPAPDVSALTTLADDIEAKSTALAAAVAANQPAPTDGTTGTGTTSATAATDPAKVIGQDGIITSPNAGATAFDPPIPGTPGPFDGAPIPAAPNSPAPVTDPANTPTGETATNVATPPSDSTLDAGLVDATSGVDQHGTITDVGNGAGTPGTASEVPGA